MIIHYTDEQLSILREINEKGYIVVTDENRAICNYLQRQKLITQAYDRFIDGRPYVARITEDGKTYLKSLHEDDKRYNTPLFISKISIAISALAFLVSVIAILL